VLPLIGAESTGEKWRAVCVARRKKRVTEAVVRRRIDRKRSFVCLTGAKRRELRNFPVDPRNAGDPPTAGAITGKRFFGFFWIDCQKKPAPERSAGENAGGGLRAAQEAPGVEPSHVGAERL